MTNNSIYTPRDLAARLRTSDLDVPAGHRHRLRPDAERHPYRASRIVESITELLAELD